ncbi:putative Zn-dependent peptidase [Clostridium sp. CAG:273]|nr:pitrilysin family protein [Clostridia bacterium]CDE84558.1 putative Zn-dependent peptidase [Clostridium sp. CAG:273]
MEGIKIHKIETNQFKTNLYAVFLATPLKRENVTKDALIAAVLRRGTKNIISQDKISKELEEMYGASFDCGIEKTGDNHIIKFYLEALNEEFLPEKEELTQKCINILLDIVTNPFVENNGFKQEYVDGEKENLKQIINGKIDNKARYSLDRCIEEIFKGEPYGLYKYGYVEDLEKITPQNLYEYYKELIKNCKIDIYYSGIFDNDNTEKIIEKRLQENNIEPRNAKYVINNEMTEKKQKSETKTVEESMDVTQGKLVLGLQIDDNNKNSRFAASVYNAILGGGANSKLFQNVREKNSLAYTASSSYIRTKNVILVHCGIDIEKYEKALETIKEQIEDMKKGNFTDKDIEDAKKLIISSVKSISAEQDTEITYDYGQELSNEHTTIKDYQQNIEQVKREQIVDIANKININTIYFLKN